MGRGKYIDTSCVKHGGGSVMIGEYMAISGTVSEVDKDPKPAVKETQDGK